LPYSCIVEEHPVFSQELVDDHAAGSRDIERVLAAQHRNPYVRVAQGQQRLGQAIHFVAEQDADRKTRLPIEEVSGVNAGFNGGNFGALLAQLADEWARFRVMWTVSSAPRAVLARLECGGRPVIPDKYRRSHPAASMVRKNAPTL
jgi:hypothetical protein